MLWNIILFFIGFYILVKGDNLLVDGSSSLARKLNVSSIVIGLVIAGIGTSIPEFAVSFIANLTGKGDIGLGTIIGSNTFNILFILGVSALFFPLTMKKYWVDRDLIWNIVAVLAAALFAFFGDGQISRWEGFLMIAIFSIWLYLVLKNEGREKEEQQEWKIAALPLSIFMILGGLVGVILGGNWVVDGAALMAKELGFSDALIGLTIVGIGTSLPELAVTFVAAYKKRPGLALGNIIGSNVFDFLMVLGVAALAKPVLFPSHLFIDISVTLFATAFLFSSMFMGKRYVLKRWQGFGFVLLYIIYIIFLVGRG
jgi:cation:H+ antiporter